MPRIRTLFAIAIVTLVAMTASADLASRDLIVPLAGRVPGAAGTNWATDLVVTNIERNGLPVQVSLSYYTNGFVASISRQLEPQQSIVLQDVVKNEFNADGTVGYIRITTSNPNAKIAASARVFNRGNAAGEYGQTVTGIPTDSLGKQHYLQGLSNTAGNRTNLGVVNPWDLVLPITIEFIGANGNSRGSFTTAVDPRRVRQFNNIFDEFGVEPQEGALVRVVSSLPHTAWATVVRNDTGDSSFVQGTGVAIGNASVVPPSCSNPAAIVLAQPGQQTNGVWIVLFKAGTSAAAKANELATRYGFRLQNVYESALLGFSAQLTPAQIASVRCEPSVDYVEENIVVPIP